MKNVKEVITAVHNEVKLNILSTSAAKYIEYDNFYIKPRESEGVFFYFKPTNLQVETNGKELKFLSNEKITPVSIVSLTNDCTMDIIASSIF
jgi:hypothetical protein